MNFSIIIPTLNEELSIKQCLIALQPLRECCEIIVVDGGSTDNTERLAKPLVDKLIASEKGRAIQMNAGVENAKGNMLIFLHADTFLPPEALNHLAQAINGKQQWGRFDVELRGSHLMLKMIAFFMNWRSRITGIATGDQVIFVNKQLFESVGYYPVIPLMEDVALCKKLKKISPPICLKTKAISSGRRWEKFGVFKTIVLMWSLRLRYFFGADPQVLALLYSRGRFWKT
ncbi:TIGR04283 family arsenosugar biosynthesis glycosyltransferase [Methyloglobulus sp.]|uniref:TIGR04283 family arsenosugar biosynthesis glycosyltransferase n=1 Tax=Methyloglobulus sp. TaxID=2518622 RepID=UPI0032B79CBD